MSTQASSSSTASGGSSSRSKNGRIEILCEATNSVMECQVPTDYVRSKYLCYKLQNPHKPQSSHGYSKEQIIMDIYGENPNDVRSIYLMLTMSHINILRAYLHQKTDERTYEVYTEKFTGSCRELYDLHFDSFRTGNFIPSKKLLNFIRSIICVLIFLHDEDEYHGAISFDTLLYCIDDNDEIVVKLANFASKNSVLDVDLLQEAQLEDWHSLGTMLKNILDKGTTTSFFTDGLKEITQYFQTLTLGDVMPNIEDLQRRFTFFWTIDDRQKFAMNLYLWCQDGPTREALKEKCNNIVTLPWNSFKNKLGDTLLGSLMAYNSHNYNGQSIIDFLKFVSAIYTHGNNIAKVKGLRQVDKFILVEFPRLFYELVSIQRQEGFMSY
ncbi:hypothetical protein LUZ62_086513 [Rhynchospora pubera]|uniref:Protein kinase domain-containing protein n=1 Tax=Rhynchospora pubera TaxID=906938 RepID=A0AAV8CDU4_9POAL|nr:hypothetical protein LUZ62_086513 [Rhynchospora pubera]